MVQKSVIINNLKINYYQSENFNKNALVFLHGWQSQSLHLKNIFSNFSNFLAIDLPGFGISEIPKEIWSIKNYADFLKDFLIKLNIKNPILVGHSFGGSIIIKYAARGGDAKKIVLIDSSGIRKRGFRVWAYFILAKIFKIIFFIPGLKQFKNKLQKIIYKIIDSEDYLNAGPLVESYKKIISEDLSEDLKKINTEATLIWGENDRDTSLKNGRLMSSLLKNSKLFIIKNAGHFPFLDQKEEFNKIFQKEINVN